MISQAWKFRRFNRINSVSSIVLQHLSTSSSVITWKPNGWREILFRLKNDPNIPKNEESVNKILDFCESSIIDIKSPAMLLILIQECLKLDHNSKTINDAQMTRVRRISAAQGDFRTCNKIVNAAVVLNIDIMLSLLQSHCKLGNFKKIHEALLKMSTMVPVLPFEAVNHLIHAYSTFSSHENVMTVINNGFNKFVVLDLTKVPCEGISQDCLYTILEYFAERGNSRDAIAKFQMYYGKSPLMNFESKLPNRTNNNDHSPQPPPRAWSLIMRSLANAFDYLKLSRVESVMRRRIGISNFIPCYTAMTRYHVKNGSIDDLVAYLNIVDGQLGSIPLLVWKEALLIGCNKMRRGNGDGRRMTERGHERNQFEMAKQIYDFMLNYFGKRIEKKRKKVVTTRIDDSMLNRNRRQRHVPKYRSSNLPDDGENDEKTRLSVLERDVLVYHHLSQDIWIRLLEVCKFNHEPISGLMIFLDYLNYGTPQGIEKVEAYWKCVAENNSEAGNSRHDINSYVIRPSLDTVKEIFSIIRKFDGNYQFDDRNFYSSSSSSEDDQEKATSRSISISTTFDSFVNDLMHPSSNAWNFIISSFARVRNDDKTDNDVDNKETIHVLNGLYAREKRRAVGLALKLFGAKFSTRMLFNDNDESDGLIEAGSLTSQMIQAEIDVLSSMGEYRQAFDKAMGVKVAPGVVLSPSCWRNMIYAAGSFGDVKWIKQVWDELDKDMEKQDFFDPISYRMVMSICLKHRRLADAIEFLEHAKKKNVDLGSSFDEKIGALVEKRLPAHPRRY